MQSKPHLQKDEELKNPPKRRREQSGVCDCHLKEERVEEPVPHVDERVLVDVRVPESVRRAIVVIVV